MNFSTDVDENVARATELVREAGQNGARIICLPELSTSQYFCIGMNRAFMEYAEPVGGPGIAEDGDGGQPDPGFRRHTDSGIL